MKIRYKYNFWRVIGEKYPGPENTAFILAKLQQEAELTEEQFTGFLNIQYHDDADVSASFLLVFSLRLGVELKELINYDLPATTFEQDQQRVPKSLQKLGAKRANQ
jgi:hypothetical protein